MYVYNKCYQIDFKDMRVQIYIFCIINTVYIVIHFGIIDYWQRARFDRTLVIFRSITLYAICYYYCLMASDLLKHKKCMLRFLKLYGVIGIIASIAVFVLMEIYMATYKEGQHLAGEKVCAEPFSLISSFYPTTIWLYFLVFYFNIR